MNTYLIPISDGNDCWIEKVIAKSTTEAENKIVKFLADDYDFIDYGDSFNDLVDVLAEHNIIIGDLYDIEEF